MTASLLLGRLQRVGCASGPEVGRLLAVPDVLFRRRRRWPAIAGVMALLLAAVAVGVAVGTRESGESALDSVDTGGAVPSPTAEPSPEVSSEATPADAGLITYPTIAPFELTAAPTAPASPVRSPSARPRVTSASPTSFTYPPPGISLQVTARRAGDARAEITIRVRDTDGSFNGGRIDFGDGTDEVFSQAVARCASPTPGPYRAEPSDRRLVLVHRYPRGGSFDVFVRVRTDRLCHDTPVEETTKTLRVTVTDPSPSAEPLPPVSPSPEPSASPSPEPPPQD